MHIHSLTFAALGPFSGEHRIDFDGLGGSALFLIDGPTGAGKSTLIDAVVFALFGDVAGRSSDRQRLRSSFAPAATVSFAEVEFSTSFGRFRVHRTPEYPRAKLRGDGVTTVPSSVLLSRSTGPEGWEPMSRNKGEADGEIQRVIGLSRAQFLQTVVLPQGEFANFLAAESKDRLAVLERIFATDLYSRVEAVLEERRRAAESSRDVAERELATSVQHVLSRLSDDDLIDVSDFPDTVGNGALVVEALDTIAVAVADRRRAQDADVADGSQALRLVTARLVVLEARADAEARVERARDCVATAVVEAEALAAALARHQPAMSSAGADASVPTEAVAAIDTAVGSLTRALEVERRLPADLREIAEMDASLVDADEAIATLVHEREHVLPRRLLALSAALALAIAEAQSVVSDATNQESGLVQRRLDGMAGELAADLAPGDPCPVCGATVHPEPAPAVANPVTPDAIDRAAGDRTAAESARQVLEVEQARLQAAGASVPSSPDVTGVTPDPAVDVAAGVRDFQARVTRLDADLGARREARASLDAHLGELRRVAAERRTEIERALDGHASIGDRVAALTSARAALRALATATDAVAEGQLSLEKAVSDLAAIPLDPSPGADASSDIETVAQERDARADELRLAASARDATAALERDLTTRINSVHTSVSARDSLRARTADIISLASIIRGGEGNSLAQPLSAYVVQTMFDEILDAANRRLRPMLDGRFELKATEQRTGRALTGLGLGLEVVDLRSDSVRKTSTLSGGETFCASLALALGLADTVRAHAGGIDIGMLFIDEGFGSLDGDRLDDVMAELLRLRADGRTVGVISHVSEMKKSILERIDVQPLGGRLGSDLTVSWGD